MSDKIAEIRARYAGYSLNSGNAGKANEDRGWLLAAGMQGQCVTQPQVPPPPPPPRRSVL